MDIPAGVILDPPNLKPWKNVPVRQHVARDVRHADGVPERRQRRRVGRVLGRGRQGRRTAWCCSRSAPASAAASSSTARSLEGEHSHGAELGHMKIEMTNPRLCGCGRCGCLEAYASATAVVKRTDEALHEDAGRRRCTLAASRTS